LRLHDEVDVEVEARLVWKVQSCSSALLACVPRPTPLEVK
jgi:hypothetical protein